jgi:ribonuclease P protein component
MQQSADFERVLAVPGCARSPHFVVHFLPSVPMAPSGALRANPGLADVYRDKLPDHIWCGYVVPKRYARRAVTRHLVKRQIRCAIQAFSVPSPSTPGMRNGLWLVRLRSSFDAQTYLSAASTALNDAVKNELSNLLARVAALK